MVRTRKHGFLPSSGSLAGNIEFVARYRKVEMKNVFLTLLDNILHNIAPLFNNTSPNQFVCVFTSKNEQVLFWDNKTCFLPFARR